ncbi:rRNA pseudouridine synthase [candidate division KSB1 bacterium]|nr:rRNA pseudouridine synthase [candidate division KSB1 bacterium]
MRINQYLAHCGVASRRSAEAFIKAGRVSLNGKVVANLATRIIETDVVRLDGKIVQPSRKKIYVLLNKPKDYITTVHDERSRRTVLDLVRIPDRIFPVGRLDAKSTGLLLLTNDGELAHRLLHPRYKLAKVYHVNLDCNLAEGDLQMLAGGVELEDGVTQPCAVRFYRETGTFIEITLHEGRKHQVRRMFAALGYKVKSLHRARFGPLHLRGLARGKWRHLQPKEIRSLKQAVREP